MNTLTLLDFITEHYEPWILQTQKSAKTTIGKIRGTVFCLSGKLLLSEISVKMIDDIIVNLLVKGIQKSTINSKLSALKAALNKAVEWELLAHNPLVKIKPFKIDNFKHKRYLSDAERKRLYKALYKEQGQIRPLIALAMNTGCRRNELLLLKDRDVNVVFKTITLSDTKNGTSRTIPLNPRSLKELKYWELREDRVAISDYYFNPFVSIHREFKRIMKKANIQNFRFHDLRHDFASRLVMKGIDLNTVRELLGHKSLTMTLRYAHLSNKHLSDAVNHL